MNEKIIKIAGAGIAGLTAAIILLKKGYRVRVYERNDDIGRRHHGDFQGLMNWGFEEDMLDFMKRIGLETDFWKIPVKKVLVLGPDNCQTQVESIEPLYYLVHRGNKQNSFDVFLKELAIKSGVEIIFNQRCNNEDIDIIATGPVFKKKPDGMALGYNFESDSKDIFINVFDKEFAHLGYAYCFIIDGQGTIATCGFSNFSEIDNQLEKTINLLRGRFNLDIRNSQKFSGIETFHLPSGNKKIIGEAGGFLDALFGFGIRYAMLSGQLAAQSIINGENFGELWKKELDGLIKTSVSNRFFYVCLGWHSYPYRYFIKRIGKSKNFRKMLTGIYKPNLISKLFYPFARLYFTKYLR